MGSRRRSALTLPETRICAYIVRNEDECVRMVPVFLSWNTCSKVVVKVLSKKSFLGVFRVKAAQQTGE